MSGERRLWQILVKPNAFAPLYDWYIKIQIARTFFRTCQLLGHVSSLEFGRNVQFDSEELLALERLNCPY